MELVKITIIPNNYQLNFGVNDTVDCTITVHVQDFNGNSILNYPITISCPDDSTQITQTGQTNSQGICTFNYTFNDTNGTGYRRFIVNNTITNSIFLYRDTGWVPALDYTSNFKDHPSANPFMMRVQDKIVTFRGTITNINAFTTTSNGYGTQIGTLKYLKFKPEYGVMAINTTSLSKAFLEINTSGNMWIARYGTTGITNKYDAGSWINVAMTYLY